MKQISRLDFLKKSAALTSRAAYPGEAHEAMQQVLNSTDNDNLRDTLERFLTARETIS